MSFRKEKKFRLTYSDQHQLKSKLLQQGMRALFPARQVNSVYFDTTNFNLFHDSEEGVLPRKKVRVRWYGSNTSSITKEVKVSSIEGRFKYAEEFSSSNLIEDFELIDSQYGLLYPSLQVSYEREYYLLSNMRITFDTKIQYHDKRSYTQVCSHEPETVMEIKTPNNCPDDFIESSVQVVTSRFSKYCRGILACNG